MKSDNGFTRFDLVIVVLCVGLLFLSLGAIGGMGRERAKIMVCQTNLKQLGQAGATYLDDNDGYFPSPHLWLLDGMTTCCQWCDADRWREAIERERMGVLWPYLENKNVLMCPTFYRLAKSIGQRVCPNMSIEPQYSYSQNGWLGPDGWTGEPHPPDPKGGRGALNVSEVKYPARTFFFSEENLWAIQGLSSHVLNDTALFIRTATSGTLGDCLATYHNPPTTSLTLSGTSSGGYYLGEGGLCEGSANLVFVDGHVELVHVGVENREDGFRLAFPRLGN